GGVIVIIFNLIVKLGRRHCCFNLPMALFRSLYCCWWRIFLDSQVNLVISFAINNMADASLPV
ncbi:MAG: hypothetical protein OEV73_09655, partial [Desulfobulbaceae bacterium]|nr:hypothetical protein [Desulfobulbaceae bacterium]